MTRSGRVVVLGSLAVLVALVLTGTAASAFSLDDVAARAEKLATASYQKPGASLPKTIKSLGYDQYRDIRFRPDRALWRNGKLPFELMFFHRGWFYEDPVTIHEVGPELIVEVRDDGRARGGRATAGFGLRGMAERVESIGGQLWHGREGDGGWVVRASLPLPVPVR
jgi:glucan biosynthesis protein